MFEKFKGLYARALVVLRAAPTYLTAAATIITVITAQLPWPGIVQAGVTVVAALTAAVSIIRRVEPVLPFERGILPVYDEV